MIAVRDRIWLVHRLSERDLHRPDTRGIVRRNPCLPGYMT